MKDDYLVLILILLIAMAHGLLYTFLVPPWQHYEEPTHFEYAWLIANRLAVPRADELDKALRRELAKSMLKHGFYHDLPYRPDLNSDGLIDIGFTAVGAQPPVYYLWAALPVRLLRAHDVTLQLYGARFASLLLYLVSIAAAWGVMREITPQGHPLCWMVPTTMALLPGYTDLMTAANNDVGATAFFSLFLWGCLRLMQPQRGWLVKLSSLLWVIISAVLCYFTKKTVGIAVPLAAVALLFAVFQGRWRWLAWSVVGVGGIAGLLAVFSWGDAAFWYRHTTQASATRCDGAACRATVPLGQNALQLQISPGAEPPEVAQPLTTEQVRGLAGKTVTFGSWIWATQPLVVETPVLLDDRQWFGGQVPIGPTPTFHAFTVSVAKEMIHPRIVLSPVPQVGDKAITVFYDGLVIAEGVRPTDEAPHFADVDGQRGEWGGRSFQNLVRDASAEQAWPWVRPWLNPLGDSIFGGRPADVFASMLDLDVTAWYYQGTAENLFQTFWAKFGWAHVPLAYSPLYALLKILTLLGVVGAVLSCFSQARALRWDAVLILGLAGVAIWMLTVLRGAGQSIWHDPYIPVARYAYPVIIPTTLVLTAGWWQIADWVERTLKAIVRRFTGSKPLGYRRAIWYFQPVYVLAFMTLDVVALYSLMRFYVGR